MNPMSNPASPLSPMNPLNPSQFWNPASPYYYTYGPGATSHTGTPTPASSGSFNGTAELFVLITMIALTVAFVIAIAWMIWKD